MITAPYDSGTRLDAAVSAAEGECTAGRWECGFSAYVDLVTRLLSQRPVVSRELTTLTSAEALILERVAELAILLGHASAADSVLEGLVITYRRVGNDFAADCATLKRLHLAISHGDRRGVEDALAALESLIGPFDQVPFSDERTAWERECRWTTQPDAETRSYFFAQFYLEAGRLFLWLGQYSDAVNALKGGLVHSAEAAAVRFTLPLGLELAAARIEQGKLADAEALLAPLLLQPALERQPGFAVRAWELDAQRRAMRGDFGGALVALERVRNLCRDSGLQRAEAAASINIAQLLIILNQTIAARRLLTAALEAATQFGDETIADRASRLLELARARRASTRGGLLIAPPVSKFWRAQDSTTAGEEEECRAFGFSRAGSAGFLDRFNDYALGHQWLLSGRQTARAGQWLAQMQEIFGVSDSPLIHLRLRVLEAMQLYYNRKLERAEGIFAAAQDELRTLGLTHELWQAGRFMLWCQTRLGHPQDAELSRETEKLLAQMSGTLDPRHRILFQLNKASSEEERLSAWLDELIAEAQAVEKQPWFRRWQARWRLWARVHAFEQEAMSGQEMALRGLLNFHAEEEEPQHRMTLWQRLSSHPWRRATASFLVLPDRTMIIRTAFLSMAFGVSPVTRIQLREWVRAWHELLAKGEEGSHQALHFAEMVGDALQFSELLVALPARVRALTVVPDDVLHGVPFAAIYNSAGFRLSASGQPQRLVANLYPVTVRNGPQIMGSASATHSKTGLLAVGVGEALGKFPALPHVSDELASVGKWFTRHGISVKRLLNHEAKIAAVASGLGSAAFAHLACHGTFDAGDLNQTGLVLRDTNGEPAILSLRDLAQLDLRGLRHITLASCWSADNYVLPGRWVLSLPQTLVTAGAESVLSSLWPVDDAIAAAFVRRFYEYARHSARDEALSQTQLDCLQNTLFPHGGLNTADACFWACFTLSGEPGALW